MRLPLHPSVSAAATKRECIMGLGILILGLGVFLGTHVFVSFRETRADAIARIGLPAYRGLVALVSLVGVVLIAWGFWEYRAHGLVRVWSPPAFMRHITIGLMLFATIFLVATFVPSHLKARLKHPMLASVKTWAFAHLLSNGDLGSILLFGTFLAWGVYARIALKHRTDLQPVVEPSGWTNDALVVAIGVIVYLALGYFHPVVPGVPVFAQAG
jgi:uncharacterized membrane protein